MKLNSCELVIAISSFACGIAKSFNEEEIAILAAVFTQLGDSLATILAHSDLTIPHSIKDEEKPHNY